jgi:hypothetical protein
VTVRRHPPDPLDGVSEVFSAGRGPARDVLERAEVVGSTSARAARRSISITMSRAARS